MEINQFNECFGLFPLISNPGIDTFDKGFLSASLFGHHFCPGWWNLPTSCSELSGSFNSRWFFILTWWGYRFTCVGLGQLQHGTGRQEYKVLCLHILAGPGQPRCFLDSFWSSLHFAFAFPKWEKRNQKKIFKKGKMAFQQANQQLLLVPVPRLSCLLCAIKKLI
jgi:hypothetical protein